MIIEVKVPQLSESVAEATLLDWHKKEGEAVARDENLIDIETDKVVLELPAPADGVLVKIIKSPRLGRLRRDHRPDRYGCESIGVSQERKRTRESEGRRAGSDAGCAKDRCGEGPGCVEGPGHRP